MSEITKIDYGYTVSNTDSIGVKRAMSLIEFDNGSFGLEMRTDYDDGNAPIVTKLCLSVIGIALLSETINMVHNIRDFPVVDPTLDLNA